MNQSQIKRLPGRSFLPIVEMKLKSQKINYSCKALLDSGSEINIMSRKCCNRLQLKGNDKYRWCWRSHKFGVETEVEFIVLIKEGILREVNNLIKEGILRKVNNMIKEEILRAK